MRESKRVLGPLDKRKRVTRCQACAARRIKCEGGAPCKYCSRTQRKCIPAPPVNNDVKFVAVTGIVSAHTAFMCSLRTHNSSIYLDLFAAFIRRCQFTSRFVSVDKDLFSLIQTSQMLYDLALGIGALEASRRASCTQFYSSDRARAVAFTWYGNALNTLRHQLAKAGAAHREDVLWGTFLFSLFELSSETSGEQFAKHMFHGTSALLALIGPSGLTTYLHQKLFDAFRVLEANRTILFGDGTLLSQPVWVSHQADSYRVLAEEDDYLDPMDTIFALKVRVATFSKRFFDQIERIHPQLRSFHPTIEALAHEGVNISRELSQWHQVYTETVFAETAYTRLALIDFHALVLFLSQAYSYYACWDGFPIPSLASEDVKIHVKVILDLAEKVQAAPHVPGVLLLFALRMAGAHATDPILMRIVVQRLDAINQEGFVVSERIKLDLQEYWIYR